MPWGRLDDGLYDHPKLDELGRDRLPAIGLWALAISWCNRRLTDGDVPGDRIRILGGSKALADRLVSAGLFDAAGGDYRVHDFLQFNDSREDVIARREADAERKRRARGGMSRPDSGGDSGEESGMESTPDSARTPSGPRARPHDRARPGPTRPIPDLDDSPISPPAGGDLVNPRANGSNPRARGTNPRAAAQAEADLAKIATNVKRYRRAQRHQAYLRGAISEDQQREWDRDDAPLDLIPDWAEHQAKVAEEAGASL